jgi:hypothetical protein
MTRPQQPELDRSGRGATDQGSARAKANARPLASSGDAGPVPPGNATTDARASGRPSRTRGALVDEPDEPLTEQ